MSYRVSDPSKRSKLNKYKSKVHKEKTAERLAGQPAWMIKPLSAGYDRLWPLRDVAIPVQIPNDEAFAIPPSKDDKRTSRELFNQINELLKEIRQDMLSEERVQLLIKFYQQIFFTDVNHVYKLNKSQLLQLFFLFLRNFNVSSDMKKTIHLFCTCRVQSRSRCPVVFGLHYDAADDVYYLRPTKACGHSHDLKFAMERIISLGFGELGQRLESTASGRRANMIGLMAYKCLTVDIPEDNRFSMDITPEMEAPEIVPNLRKLVKLVPMPNPVPQSIHNTFEKLFNIKDEVYAFTCSQLCLLLRVYQKCLIIDPSNNSYSSVVMCSPSMVGSIVNVGKCGFRLTLTPDYVRSRFYLSFLAGKHLHGIEHCALKCKVDPSIFGVTTITPRVVKRIKPSRTRTQPIRRYSRNTQFHLKLSLLEISNCSEPVNIPEDDEFHFELHPDIGGNDLIENLKSKYLLRLKPDVVHPSIHETFARIFYIKHQIYRFTVSELCQFLLVYQEVIRLSVRKRLASGDLVISALCSFVSKGCNASCTLYVDFKKQVIYWRKVGDPLIIEKHSHSFEDAIGKAGYQMNNLNLNLSSFVTPEDARLSNTTV
ncbi:unnamed protein product [Ambrosiozyma monospora]|uniref:Unnamed protein product n=1 Tax=Ambrosiozyma monospora TaxID=43982 RepID=A0A9W6YV84_AMBMO|nr:unnamed protein product [Ambrosiozyma monospora]